MDQQPKPSGVPREGELLAGKYLVEHVLGTGGMGVVVAARHTALGQRVAIKLLLPEVSKVASANERFLREARAAVGIKSEHVARVLDLGTLESGASYIAMEYLEGCDLKQLSKSRGQLPIQTAVDYVVQACEAIAEAHTLGIVHRDLKPANLFLTSRADGTALVKVLDFGISKTVAPGSIPDDGSGLTRTDALLGSPCYMAPEQIRNAKLVDQRTDVWALGIILYELLVSEPPFDADNIATLSTQICMDPAAPISAYRADVPAGLEAVILRCLEKDPAKRPQNMAALSQALLPFAPEHAKNLVDRIVRLSRTDGSLDATLAASRTPLLGGSAAGASNAGWGSTRDQGRRRGTWVIASSIGLAIVGAGIFAIRGLAPSLTPAARPSATAAVPETRAAIPSAAATPPLREPAEGPSAVPPRGEPAAPLVSAAPSVHQPARRRAPAAAPSKCERGQTLSKGHCCALGLVWQGSRCDRPLATDVSF